LPFLAILTIAAVAMVAVYMKGYIDGRTGKGFQLTPEILAAEAKLSLVKARARDAYFFMTRSTRNMEPTKNQTKSGSHHGAGISG
jgi:hypothetical protein